MPKFLRPVLALVTISSTLAVASAPHWSSPSSPPLNAAPTASAPRDTAAPSISKGSAALLFSSLPASGDGDDGTTLGGSGVPEVAAAGALRLGAGGGTTAGSYSSAAILPDPLPLPRIRLNTAAAQTSKRRAARPGAKKGSLGKPSPILLAALM